MTLPGRIAEMPTMNSNFQVIHVPATSKLPKCRCLQWIDHYYNHVTSKVRRSTCSVLTCQREATDGAHVQLVDQRASHDHWIVPLCRSHNKQYNAVMWIDARTYLVSAEIDRTGCMPNRRLPAM